MYKITQKKFDEIKNKSWTMISYDLKTMERHGTITEDLVSLMEYQLIRPDLGHLVMANETYALIPMDVKYGNKPENTREMIDIAFQYRWDE